MLKLINKIKFWYGNSRPYTVSITLLSWFCAFLYAVKHGGNIIAGILSYVGIAVVHLATNLSDDYFDYKRLIKDGKFDNGEKSNKCRYLLDGSATVNELRNVILIMFSFAALIGMILFFVSGYYVLLFACLALPIAVFYSVLSSRGLGDFAVIIAYGPLMFCGVYYVMTKNFSYEVLILSVAVSFIVNTILYAHMLMDFDGDIKSGKMTLCTRLKTKNKALVGLVFFYAIAYLFIVLLMIKTANLYYILPFLTVPLVIDLYKQLNTFINVDKNIIPRVRFWHLPLDKWDIIGNTSDAPFFFRFFYARNIAIYFMILACLACLLK